MGEGQFLDFMGRHSCYEGGHNIELMGVPPVPPLGKTLHISCMVMSSEVTNTLSIPTV